MEILFQLFYPLRRWFWRCRKFWKRVYYGFTNLLMIIGCSALIFGIWYFFFNA